MPYNIFVSYSRSDAAFARRLTDSLQQVGAEVWIDVADIRSGDDWSDSIQQALDDCNVMIVVLTPESMDSVNVSSEWKYYLDEGKTVIPVLVHETRVHFRLKPLNYINFVHQDYETAFAQLRAEIERKGIVLGSKNKTREDAPVSSDDSRSFQTLAIGVAIAVLALAAVILASSTIIDLNGDDGKKANELSPQEIAETLVAQRDATQTAAALIQEPVETPGSGAGNLLNNSGFEAPFVGDEPLAVAQNWQPWSLLGDESNPHTRPDYREESSKHIRSGQSAQAYTVEDGTFIGGVFQQVAVTQGILLNFSVFAYIEADSEVQITVGIDPSGGADATKAGIVWSEPAIFSGEYRTLSVQTTAQSATVTVFVRSEGTGPVTIYLDDASLIALGG